MSSEYHSDADPSKRDRTMMESSSFEAHGQGKESSEKSADKDKKKKRHLVLVEEPKEAEGARKVEKQPDQTKPFELPKPKTEQAETEEEPTHERPKLFVVPGLKPDLETDEPAAKKGKEEETAEPSEGIEEPLGPTDEAKKPETAEAHEEEDLGEVAEDETPIVISKYIEAAKPALQQERAELSPDDPELPEVMADVIYLDALRNRAEKGEPIDEPVLDEVLSQTAEALDLAPEALDLISDEDELPEESSEETLEQPADLEGANETDDDDEEGNNPITKPVATSTPASTSTPNAANALPPTPPVVPITPTATHGMPTPPIPPLGSGSGGPPPFGPGGPLGPNAGPFGPNVLANAAPNVLPPTPERRKKKKSKEITKYAAVAAVSYLVGRRRGRIKTEERLLPVQHKLERNVKDLQEKVAIREQRIRKLTAQKVAQDAQARKHIMEKAETAVPFFARLDRRPEPEQAAQATQAEKLETTQATAAPETRTPETRLPQPVSAEAERAGDVAEAPAYREREIVYNQREPEKLGKFVVHTPEHAATLAPVAAAETVARAFEAPEAMPEKFTVEQMDALPSHQLLEFAAKVEIGGVTAEQLYRADRLDNAGLRKVVTEYVRGGHPEKVLEQQMKIVEAKRQSPEFLRSAGAQPTDKSSPVGGGAPAAGLLASGLSVHPTQTSGTSASPPEPGHVLPVQQPPKTEHNAALIVFGTVAILGIALLVLLS